MGMLIRAVILLVASTFCSLLQASPCLAQVQLPAVNLGLTSFEDGLSPAGWFFDAYGESYNADEFKDSRGNVVAGKNRLTADSLITDAIYVSDGRLFGGMPTFVAFLPWSDVDLKLANGVSSRVSGLADLTVAAGLQWPTEKIGDGIFGQRLMLAVSLPIGQYNDKLPANIGNNFVMFNPYYSFTYEYGKVEFSSRIHYLWNSPNQDPDVALGASNVQAGQAFHMNFAASYELTEKIRVGFNGYWLQQLTDDKLNGINIPRSLERTVGLGGGIRYFAGGNAWLFLNGYSETAVANRAQGFSVIFRVVKAIPNEDAQE